MMAEQRARSRIGRQWTQNDGTTTCDLQIPLGHPASKRQDQDGEVFEVEHRIEYVAGPGNQELRWINPATNVEEPVGEDLLPTSEDDAARINAANLSAYLRKNARLFDAAVRSVSNDETAVTADAEEDPGGERPATRFS